MPEPVVVADSGPLIALAVIGQLDLLPRLFPRVIVPAAVWDDVTIRGAGLPGADAVAHCAWIEVRQAEPDVLEVLSVLVDRGEAEALALARGIQGSELLLDDAQARRVAERLGIPRLGTLGLLRRAKKAGLIDLVAPFIEQLQRHGIYIGERLAQAVLRDVGEL